MQNLFLINEWNYRACYKKASIKTLKLKQLSLKCDNLMRWIDYLRLISYKSDALILCPCFQWVRNSSNNSQFFVPGNELEWCPFDMVNISLIKSGKVSHYIVSVSYENQSVNLFSFTFLGSKEGSLMSQIDIYGKAWRLQSALNGEFLIDAFIRSLILWWVDKEEDLDMDLEKYSDADVFQVAFLTYYVSRVDFRIDFRGSYKDFYKDYTSCHPHQLLKRNMKGKGEFYNEDGSRLTDMVVGSKDSDYMYIRFYDKKQEIKDDNTQFLYSDYYNYNGDIFRLEFQFMSRFCTARWKYNWLDVFIDNKIIQQIYEYIGLDIKNGVFSRFYSPQKIPFEKLPLWKKKSIGTSLVNRLNYLMDNGINPFSFIDAVYKLKWDNNRLKDFQDNIPKYIDNKDIVLKLLDLLNDNWLDNK